ncbi:hypothetical protein Dimus_021251 [Dionaea muscipula]
MFYCCVLPMIFQRLYNYNHPGGMINLGLNFGILLVGLAILIFNCARVSRLSFAPLFEVLDLVYTPRAVNLASAARITEIGLIILLKNSVFLHFGLIGLIGAVSEFWDLV